MLQGQRGRLEADTGHKPMSSLSYSPKRTSRSSLINAIAHTILKRLSLDRSGCPSTVLPENDVLQLKQPRAIPFVSGEMELTPYLPSKSWVRRPAKGSSTARLPSDLSVRHGYRNW
jgi:hypothetical protein